MFVEKKLCRKKKLQIILNPHGHWWENKIIETDTERERERERRKKKVVSV
jgi:hypothetical protein